MSISPPKKSFKDRFVVKDCANASKRIRIITYVVSLTTIILVGLFIGFLYIGASCVVNFHFNSNEFEENDIHITPTQPIILSESGLQADSSNATFTVNKITISTISPKFDRAFGRELYYFQIITGRTESNDIDLVLQNTNIQNNSYIGGSMYFINNTNASNPQPRDISLRLSADYQISIQMVILVDFINPSETDKYLSFYYIDHFGEVDSLGRPNGELTIPLKRFTILDITIKNITILYSKMEGFFADWNTQADITSYPYILELDLAYKTDLDFFSNTYNK